MRIVVQRVQSASVTVEDKLISGIAKGLMVLLGAEEGDSDADAAFIADKIVALRIFEDEEGKMNLAIDDVGGEVLLVSQFTLLGDARKGRRPSFIKAMQPHPASALCDKVAAGIAAKGITVKQGVFGADMQVALVNDGPVTILLDSKKLF